MKKLIIFTIAVFVITFPLASMDFGIVLNQSAEGGSEFDTISNTIESDTNYKASLVPRVSFQFGKSMELFVSAGVFYNYNDDTYPVPELLRTEFTWTYNRLKIALGRMQITTPIEYVANGLYDGLHVSYESDKGTFSSGIWYTGFQYKKSANIVMTNGFAGTSDQEKYEEPLNYSDFVNTYFASRRLVTSLFWEHPGIAKVVRVKAGFIQQVDLNGNPEYLNSRYFMAKFGFSTGSLLFELGGVFQMVQTHTDAANNFIWEFGVFYNIPTVLPSRISFTGNFSNFDSSNILTQFRPINAKSFGQIVDLPVAGVSILTLDYSARLLQSLSLSVGTSYYMLSDINLVLQNGFFLNNELYARVVWSPGSDWQFNASGGIALPGSWKITFGAVLAFL